MRFTAGPLQFPARSRDGRDAHCLLVELSMLRLNCLTNTNIALPGKAQIASVFIRHSLVICFRLAFRKKLDLWQSHSSPNARCCSYKYFVQLDATLQGNGTWK